MNMGLFVSIDTAIDLTNMNNIESFSIWEQIDEDQDVRHSIECTIWQSRGDPTNFCKPLVPYDGRCHTFQFRIEALDEDGDVDELLDADEPGAGGIQDLVECVPAKWRLEAEQAVTSWLNRDDIFTSRLEVKK